MQNTSIRFNYFREAVFHPIMIHVLVEGREARGSLFVGINCFFSFSFFSSSHFHDFIYSCLICAYPVCDSLLCVNHTSPFCFLLNTMVSLCKPFKTIVVLERESCCEIPPSMSLWRKCMFISMCVYALLYFLVRDYGSDLYKIMLHSSSWKPKTPIPACVHYSSFLFTNPWFVHSLFWFQSRSVVVG